MMKNLFKNWGGKTEKAKNITLDLSNEEKVLEYLLNDELKDILGFVAERAGDYLWLPELQMTIRPMVQQMQYGFINLGFDMYCGKWDKYLYESSTGMGQDMHTSVGMAISSFAFAFMQGLKRMVEQDEPRKVESEFLGARHKWDVYLSDVVGTGNYHDEEIAHNVAVYWDLLREDIIKRLGNQRMVYVKIYGAKLPDQVVGECRIDDVAIPELGEKVAGIVAKWQTNEFASHKQFFFIEQDAETVLPQMYDGQEGRARLKALLVEYLKLLHAVDSQEAYDRLERDAEQKLGDKVLAAECFSFLPEICAEHAFVDEVAINDEIELEMADGTSVVLYKSQLADYYLLGQLLFEIFSDGTFGEKANQLYGGLVSCSSIYNVMEQVKEKGGETGNVRLTKLIFNVGDGFQLR
ncbi:MAG: hypothetical protein IJ716_11690 [Lachnospiraceae bacterium]|nr:hypothetical protein [Lachnospiraceae bacterium]